MSADIINCLEAMTALCRLKYGNLDSDVSKEIDRSLALIEKHKAIREAPLPEDISSRDALIAKQQLEIEDMRTRLADIKKAATSIIMEIVGVGGPLNDNVKGYSKSQFGDWKHALYCAEEIENLAMEKHERD